MGHTYIGHDYMGHTYIDHNYIGQDHVELVYRDGEEGDEQQQASAIAARRRKARARARVYFLASFRRTPAANAEGLDQIGGQHRRGLTETRPWAPSDRHGSSAIAVGMRRGVQKKTALGRAPACCARTR